MTTRQDLVALLDILNSTIQQQEEDYAIMLAAYDKMMAERNDAQLALSDLKKEYVNKSDLKKEYVNKVDGLEDDKHSLTVQLRLADAEIVRLRQEKDDADFVTRKWEEECERIRRQVSDRYPFVGTLSDNYETDRSYDPTDDMPTDDVHGIPDDVLDEMPDCVPKG